MPLTGLDFLLSLSFESPLGGPPLATTVTPLFSSGRFGTTLPLAKADLISPPPPAAAGAAVGAGGSVVAKFFGGESKVTRSVTQRTRGRRGG